jgi:Protein of unknown function (DUF1203)
MAIHFIALETGLVTSWRNGAPDANGLPAELNIAESDGYPCRHCLKLIPKGATYLTVGHRPFPSLQPYAEVGPLFVHAADCQRGGGDAKIPAFLDSALYLVRGYGADDRIVPGTGTIEPTDGIPTAAETKFEDPAVRYLHVRSASNNCYHCRIDRTD